MDARVEDLTQGLDEAAVEIRALAKDRKATFARTPTVSNRVWQLDFSEVETTTGGIWRIGGCRDGCSKV